MLTRQGGGAVAGSASPDFEDHVGNCDVETCEERGIQLGLYTILPSPTVYGVWVNPARKG